MIRFWLLNLAVEMPISLTCIFPQVASELLNVRPVPGCDSRDYANQLLELWGSRQIEILSEVSGDDLQSATGVAKVLNRFSDLATGDSHQALPPSHRHLAYSSIPSLRVSFKLTADGGAAWEKIAEPCWWDYVWVLSDDDSGDITSPNLDRLIAYLGWWSLQHPHEEVQWKTIDCEEQVDFNLPYWKHFPRVYHASFNLRPSREKGPGWYERPKWFAEWYRSTYSWYRQPWELPGWPSK